ncbi:hypothetical protein [Streptomyces sp. B21-101]|uniref:hypothetical protein n=1 Tax=Streptomyces sp. B21-101 TaxID=3039415 RepID=UPI002FEFF974
MPEFMCEIVELRWRSGRSVGQVAKDFDCPTPLSCLTWVLDVALRLRECGRVTRDAAA